MSNRAATRILVTGVAGVAGVAVLRALAEEPYDLVGADCDPHAAGLHLAPGGGILLPRADSPRYVDAVLAAVCRLGIGVVVPTVDEELLPLAAARNALCTAGAELLAAPIDSLRTCLDKWSLIPALAESVPVPRTALLDEDFRPSQMLPPCIVKPRTGRGGVGVELIRDAAEFNRLPRDGSLIVQEELPGAEYSIDVLVDEDGQVVASVPRERLEVDSGVAVTARTVSSPLLEGLGAAAALAAGIRGPANVQFREDQEGRPRLLEINPSFPGTLSITVASGVNLAALAIRDLLGEPLPEHAGDFQEVAIVRFLEEKAPITSILRSTNSSIATNRVGWNSTVVEGAW